MSNKKMNEDFYYVNKNADYSYTSLKGHIVTTYAKLEKLFGKPIEGDGYKVSGNWVFQSQDGEVFTIYDWKSTKLYDLSLPSVEAFRSNEYPFEFNVGGSCKAEPFIEWLKSKLV